MKLKSAHILNFGKLSDIKYEFVGNLTAIKEDNSFGKTTLANFIISMFYGLPNLKVKDLSNDRRRYDPWQSGGFGGLLTFEYKDKIYQIERDFNKDTFHLYDISTRTKKEVFTLDDKPINKDNFGDVLFDINKNSFRRSAYIPQDDVLCGEIESGLNDKLRNLINATDEGYDFKQSLKILQNAADSIQAKRGKGKLKDVAERIASLEAKIKECEICFDNAERDRLALSQLKKQHARLDTEIEKIDKEIGLHKDKDAKVAQRELYLDIQEEIKKANTKLAELSLFFKAKTPDDIDLTAIKDKIDAYYGQQKVVKDYEDSTLQERAKLQNIQVMSNTRQERKKMLAQQIEGYQADIKRTLAKKNDTQQNIAALEKEEGHKGLLFVILCIITFGIFYILTKKKNAQRAEKIALLEQDLAALSSKIDGFQVEISKLQTQIDEIDAASSDFDPDRLGQLNNTLDEENRKLQSCKTEVDSALTPFGYTPNNKGEEYTSYFYQIKAKHNEFVQFTSSLSESNAKLKEFLQDKDENTLLQEIIFETSLEELEQQKSDSEKERLAYIKEISDTEASIARNEEKAEDLSNYRSELSECYELSDKLTTDLATLEETMKFLTKANDNLANKYLAPLLVRGKELINLYDESKSDLGINDKFEILIKENGFEREFDYFSKGIKELVSICMRFALVDMIFKDSVKKPFIILDDPFANLDDSKLLLAKEFIVKLSKDYQIIYLTCHASREIIL
ncbi:MAG: AAA family ATPase [Clostridia bacterium]